MLKTSKPMTKANPRHIKFPEKPIPIVGTIGGGTRTLTKIFPPGSPFDKALRGISVDYYKGRIGLRKAQEKLTALGGGQGKWIKEALANLCKPRLYLLGQELTTRRIKGGRLAGVYLEKGQKWGTACTWGLTEA